MDRDARAHRLVVVGLMSGTSGDGVDSAVVRLDCRLTAASASAAATAALHRHHPFDAAQRRTIFSLFDDPPASALCRANVLLGEWFAGAAQEAVAAAGLELDDVDLIGSHGQTVFHCPPDVTGRVACTLQIGEPAVIAERTGITTLADFRVRDVAAGGHGAPLVSFVDALLFRRPGAACAVLNLGGIANLTILPPLDEPALQPVAFDSGPGNMVLDWLASACSGGLQACDLDGRLARAGTVDGELLDELLSEPYFARPAPKTTGRELFGRQYAEQMLARARARKLSAEATLATATALTAETVAQGLLAARGGGPPVEELIAGGGGTRNPALMDELARRLPGVRLVRHEAYGISSQAKEALSFAILAACAVRGVPNTLPSCTGARHPVVMGKLIPGSNYTALMRRLFGEAARV